MLGFDYFTLLDLLTIARSRKHIEKYYGTAETGRFPDRLKPINIKADVDRAGEFRSIRDINHEIRRLNLAAYAPLRYVLPHKQAAYDEKYSTEIRGGEGFFRQVDREESLIHLLRVNVLKRMESAVPSFALTVRAPACATWRPRWRASKRTPRSVEEIDIEDVDIDDPAFESLLVGRKVKVLLKDVDLVRWKQDLIEDRNRLATLLAAARQVDAARDAKLAALREVIEHKCRDPINPGNRKVIVFTAFADTAHYLYEQLAPWAQDDARHRHRRSSPARAATRRRCRGCARTSPRILTAFSPRSKERPEELAGEGELDLLIATDCISEGQNLQDCDWLINYDIHWNPVRIIQRFGRIDRIGSPNERIQLVNFWPNMELEEYINLEQRVSGRMVLLDISATGEENLIEQQSGNQMNDLEYRRKQLLKLQDAVIDLEDLSTGVSIADLTLTDFRIDLARVPQGASGRAGRVCRSAPSRSRPRPRRRSPPGIIFCLRAEGEAADARVRAGLSARAALSRARGRRRHRAAALTRRPSRSSTGSSASASGATCPMPAPAPASTRPRKQGEDMRHAQRLLAAAVASVVGKSEERAVASLFTPGRHARPEGRVRRDQRLRGGGLSGGPAGGGRHERGRRSSPPSTCPPARAWTSACRRSCWWRTVRRRPPTSATSTRASRSCSGWRRSSPRPSACPTYRDDVREYLEIAVLTPDAAGRGQGRPARRAGPPRGALSGAADRPSRASALALSLAHKRWSQGEAGADGARWRASSPSSWDARATMPDRAAVPRRAGARPPAATYAATRSIRAGSTRCSRSRPPA